MEILVNVIGQKLKVTTNLKCFISGSQQFVKFIFNMDSEWDNLLTFAQFRQNGVAYNQYLDEDNSVYLPSEIGAGACTLILYGTGGDVRATTNYLTLTIDENILVTNAQSTEITQSLYEQLVNSVTTTTNRLQDRVANVENVIQGLAGGAPIVVSSVSEMIDTEQIYILSTDGMWYYHNGTAWTAGGEYGAVATDTTLTQSGVPADAKATGDEIKNSNEHCPKPVETLGAEMFEKGTWSGGIKGTYKSANRARTKTFLYAAKSINVYRKYTYNEAQIFTTFYTISGEISSSVSWTGSTLIPKGSIFTLIITESNNSLTERTVDELYDMFHVSIADKDVIFDYDSGQWTFSAGYISSNGNKMVDGNLKMSVNQYFAADHRFAHIDCASGYTLSLIGYDNKFGIVKTAEQFGSKTGNVFVDMEGCAFFRVTVTFPSADVTEQDVIDSVSISKNGSTGVGNANIISISKDGINDSNKDYAPKYPKSSLVSLRKAYEQGFRDVILHVQFTSDNIPVVYHDLYINRYARNADGSTIQTTININETTLEVLNTYDFGIAFGEQYKGTKITLFEDALSLCKNLGFKIWIEPSTSLGDEKETIVFDLIKKYGMDCRIAYFSYYASTLARVHQKVPRADLLFHPSGDDSRLEENLVANLDNLSALIDKNDVYAYVSGDLTDETKMLLKNAGVKRMAQCLDGFEPTNIKEKLISNKDCNAVITQIMPAYSVNM